MRWLACCAEPHWASTVVRAGLPRQARVQPGVAGDVVGLLARLGDAAADHLLDLGGIQARPVE